MSPDPNTVFFVMGVSGCGKSTLGQLLADKLGLPFFDGDDFHPKNNIDKMSRGEALTDEDRIPWLERLNAVGHQHKEPGCVIACSALKQKYRDILSSGIEQQVAWVYQEGDYETILSRLQGRKGHFMPPALLTSQFETLEPPVDAISIPVSISPEEQLELAIKLWNKKKKSGQ